MTQPTKTYSSVKEVLESGILDRHRLHQAAAMASNPSGPGPGRHPRRSSHASTTGSASSSLCQSFTSGVPPARRISVPDARRQSSFASISEDSALTITSVRLDPSPPPQEIDLSEMSSDDIQDLKERDPFMYYSIPEVHSRSYRFDESSAADIVARVTGGPEEEDEDQRQGQENEEANDGLRPRRRSTRRSVSMPAGMLADADMARAAFEESTVVSKRRRLSVEAHPTLVCEEMLGRMAEEAGGDEEQMEEEERFLDALMMNAMGEGEEDADDEV